MPLLTVYTSRPHPADAAAMLKYIEFANPPGHLWGHDGGTFE
jgi:hypothetical protein